MTCRLSAFGALVAWCVVACPAVLGQQLEFLGFERTLGHPPAIRSAVPPGTPGGTIVPLGGPASNLPLAVQSVGWSSGAAVDTEGVSVSVGEGNLHAASFGGESSGKAIEGGKGCETECYQPRLFAFGELLDLRSRDSRVAYAVAADSNLPAPPVVQIGSYEVLDQNWQAAFRIGAGWYTDDCSSIGISYARFEGSQADTATATAPMVLRSLVRHPQGPSSSAGGDFLDATAQHDIDFDLIDVDYRSLWRRCDNYDVKWLVGVRYATLDQEFDALFENNGFETLATGISFDGLGPRLGLEGERFLPCGLSLYGKGAASFVVGEFQADFQQASDAAPLPVTAGWEAGQIVPILDLELGMAWISPGGRLRLSSGYLISGWFNTVETDRWIQAVQNNNTVGLGDTMTFDGFTLRADLRF